MDDFSNDDPKIDGPDAGVQVPKDELTANGSGPPDGQNPSGPHGQNDLFPEFAILWLLINQIEAQPRRIRRARKSQQAAVMRSIERFGFRIPILVAQNTA